jgi:glycosyltransferase involved in cell wall biosynthesis
VVGPRRAPALPEGATWFGYVPAPKLPEFFARATVFVLPTLREPFGLAFLDAMASGLPCVGTRVEAVPELVRHGETGLLVPPGDPSALVDALESLLANRDRARAMGAEGRRVVEENYSWSRVAERLEELLGRATELPCRRPGGAGSPRSATRDNLPSAQPHDPLGQAARVT